MTTELPLSAFGEVLVAQMKPEAGWRFDYGVNTRIVKVTTANGGTVTADGNRAKLSTGTNPAGLARIETLKRLRYFPGMGGVFRMTSVFCEPKAGLTQYVGIGDVNDRLFFGYNGLDFGVGRRRGGVDTFVAATGFKFSNDADWNRALGNIYQCRFQWLGYGYLRFFMLDFESEDGGYRRLHTFDYPNTSQDVHILNPTLPLFAEVENDGNETDGVLYTPSAGAFSEGLTGPAFNPLDVYNSHDNAATFANTSNNHLMTIRNKTTYNAQDNRVPVEVSRITVSRGTGASFSRIRLYRDATTADALTYADVDATNSPVDTSDTTTTVTSTASEKAYSLPASTAPLVIEFKPGEVVLQPGESLTIGIQNSGVQSTEVVATVDWAELF